MGKGCEHTTTSRMIVTQICERWYVVFGFAPLIVSRTILSFWLYSAYAVLVFSFVKRSGFAHRNMQWSLLILFSLTMPLLALCSSECVWATGRVVCHKNQTRVIGSIVELWDLDSPRNVTVQLLLLVAFFSMSLWLQSDIKNPVDPDDKAKYANINRIVMWWWCNSGLGRLYSHRRPARDLSRWGLCLGF